eukprot:8160367-Pyramimonas_sp.AAC.1
MAASKESLLETGVLKANHADIGKLLRSNNVDAAALVKFNQVQSNLALACLTAPSVPRFTCLRFQRSPVHY